MPTNAVPIGVAVVGIMGNAKKCEKIQFSCIFFQKYLVV